MKSHLYQAALLAALALGSAPVAQAQLSGTYTSGDLLAGFTTGSGFDVIYDLGQESALVNGETWSGLTSLLSSQLNNSSGFGAGTTASSLSWGIIGNGPASGASGTRTLWTTTLGEPVQEPATVHGNSQFDALNNAAGALAENFSGASTENASATVAANTIGGNSWNLETTGNATLSTSYILEYENPNVNGITTDTFSQLLNDGYTVNAVGGFSLNSSDVLTFNTVPEPSSFALLGGAGSLVLAFRNKLSRKQA